MGAAVTPFVFENQSVRSVRRDGEPWFVVDDVCRIIDIKNPTQVVGRLDEDERGLCSIHTPGGLQEMVIVSESGLYTLILRSRAATTPGTVQHRFRRWVTSEVLPSIRKTGSYGKDWAPRRSEPPPVTPGTHNVTMTFEQYEIAMSNIIVLQHEVAQLTTKLSAANAANERWNLRLRSIDMLLRDTALSDEEIAKRVARLLKEKEEEVPLDLVTARRLRQSKLS